MKHKNRNAGSTLAPLEAYPQSPASTGYVCNRCNSTGKIWVHPVIAGRMSYQENCRACNRNKTPTAEEWWIKTASILCQKADQSGVVDFRITKVKGKWVFEITPEEQPDSHTATEMSHRQKNP